MLKKVKQIFFMAWLFLASFAAIPNLLSSLTRPLGVVIERPENSLYLQEIPVTPFEDFVSRILLIGLTFFLIAIPSYALDKSNPDKGFWAIKIPTQENQLTPIFCGAGLATFLIFLRT